jgi:hypothetical protein
MLRITTTCYGYALSWWCSSNESRITILIWLSKAALGCSTGLSGSNDRATRHQFRPITAHRWQMFRFDRTIRAGGHDGDADGPLTT